MQCKQITIQIDHLFLPFSIDVDENLVESEYEDDDDDADGTATQRRTDNDGGKASKISWLLQIALENLGVTVSSYIVRILSFLF